MAPLTKVLFIYKYNYTKKTSVFFLKKKNSTDKYFTVYLYFDI